MKSYLDKKLLWVQSDFKSNGFRFMVELFAWALSIGCSVVMAFTVPHPPLIELYTVWIAGCIMYCWASYSRGSFGMLLNYLALVSIDSIALFRLLY